MADDDLVDIVDVDDRVVGQVSRAEMRRQGLRHRAVYVLVRTGDDGVVVHRRADWKDVYPGAWDLCFGGVLDVGEAWEDAAVRELAEEAGIEAELTLLGGGGFDDDANAVVGRVYEGVHDGPYPCPDGEVVETRVVPRAELRSFLAEHEHCNDSAAIVLPLLDT
ncbi:MAG: NUDIX domain-containing protein [Acidimicrobiales bacterium]|nr:NUDIX domain-containing protein [Acidimicrobiales bacterium]